MNDKNELIVSLLHKSINGLTLTETEEQELEAWISRSEYNRRLYNEVMNAESMQEDVKSMLNYDSKALWKKINKEIHPEQSGGRLISFFRDRRPFKYAAAAVLLIVISTTAYLMFLKPDASRDPVSSTQHPAATPPDLVPGTEKAVLILADGSSIVLDNTANGQIATQGETKVIKEDGLLAYNNADNNKAGDKVMYNTIRTAKGQQFSSLVLSDGSKIWLNAASSITFPTAFSGKQRLVEITGEAYFEIAKNPSMPFIASVKGMKVEVLGTHFNINAYDDEAAIKTTLLEGAVKVTANGKSGFLKPGQQAQLASSGDIKVKSDANVEEVVAWKNGVFIFQNEDMTSIMRQVARWYDVDVVFKDQITERYVATSLSRNVPVSKLLQIFEAAGAVHFEINETNKKIIVSH
jgi:transmembrane sensor